MTQYGMSPLGHQVFGQPNHEVFLGRDYGNTQDYSDETAKRIDDEVARIMREAHDRAYEILSTHADQMHLMANVLIERETVEGEACLALLDNRWDEYLAHEDEIIARKEAEEAAARARDEQLADPNWRMREQGGLPPQGGQPMQVQPVPMPTPAPEPEPAPAPVVNPEPAPMPEPEAPTRATVLPLGTERHISCSTSTPGV